jgi:hypothetical protein
MAAGVLIFTHLPAVAADTWVIADIRSARSVMAEGAALEELSARGALTSEYERIARRQVRDQLQELAAKDRSRSPALAQDIEMALQALDAGRAEQLRALVDALTALDRNATAD